MTTRAAVSACLVTRGNVPMEQILATLEGFDEVIVHDNSAARDLGVAGRFAAVARARNDLVYLQDDDVVFEHQDELLAAHDPRLMVANWGHGDNAAGYEDLPLVPAGAIVDRRLLYLAIGRYLAEFPPDKGWMYECDFIVGSLIPFAHVRLPYTRLYADDDTRLCRQPWQEELKREMTERARALRARAGRVVL